MDWRNWPWYAKVGAVFAVYYVLKLPKAAAHTVNEAFAAIGDAGTQLAIFVNSLG